MTLIADMIREAREAAGLTRTEAARAAGTTYFRWREWEEGLRTPRDLDAVIAAFKTAAKPPVRRSRAGARRRK